MKQTYRMPRACVGHARKPLQIAEIVYRVRDPFQAHRAKENSPGRKPWDPRDATQAAPERGVTLTPPPIPARHSRNLSNRPGTEFSSLSVSGTRSYQQDGRGTLWVRRVGNPPSRSAAECPDWVGSSRLRIKRQFPDRRLRPNLCQSSNRSATYSTYPMQSPISTAPLCRRS
jgi:hypothetical protein